MHTEGTKKHYYFCKWWREFHSMYIRQNLEIDFLKKQHSLIYIMYMGKYTVFIFEGCILLRLTTFKCAVNRN
jgi:hypothetical protein